MIRGFAGSAFQAAVAAGYRIASYASIQTSTGPVTVPLSGGRLTVNRTAATWRNGTITVSDPTGLIPTADLQGALTPFGNEITLQAGWQTDTGPVLSTIGVLSIETVTIADTGSDLTLTASGYDRSWVMGLRAFTAPYTIAASTNGAAALSTLVSNVLGDTVPQNIVPTGIELQAVTYNENTNPWTAAQSIAAALGYEVFFDAIGTFTARPIPNPAVQAVAWTYSEGVGNTNTGLSRSITRQGIANDEIVTGSGTNVATPVRGQAQVTDPVSPMYVDGPFGDVPAFTNSSLITTADQAAAAASNLLALSLGGVETLTATVVRNPGLEPDDVIYFKRDRAGVDGYYVLDTVTVDLGPMDTTVTGRRVQR